MTIRVLAVVLAFLVLLANYPVYKEGHMATMWPSLPCCSWEEHRYSNPSPFCCFTGLTAKRAKVQDITSRKELLCFFLGPFILIAVIDLGYLFWPRIRGFDARQCKPSETADDECVFQPSSLLAYHADQAVDQRWGDHLWKHMNAAVVLYSVFQILSVWQPCLPLWC